MSFSTKPAYIIHPSGWEDKHREHPVMDWMMDHNQAFDWGNAKKEPYTNWLTEDFRFVDGTGKVTQGAEAWAAVLSVYAPLAAHSHEPFFGVIYETDTGYELIGCAKVYANLLVPGEGVKKKDLKGREWDVEFPGAFHFKYVRDATGPKGLKVSEEKLYADGSPLIGKLLERGMVTPEDLLKKLAA